MRVGLPEPFYFKSTVNYRGTNYPFRVMVSVPRKFDDSFLQRLGVYASNRGVFKTNISDTYGPLKYVRITCQSMTVPIEILDYVVNENLPFDVLEQPEFLTSELDDSISGDGHIILLRGVAIARNVRFKTDRDEPIIVGQDVTIGRGSSVMPGAVILPRTIVPDGTFIGRNTVYPSE